MKKPFQQLTKNFSPERKARIAEQTIELLLEYEALSQPRKDNELTQQELADVLQVRQNAISKLENQDDMLIKTLAKYIDALGGELEIRAHFDDKIVVLSQFADKDSSLEAH